MREVIKYFLIYCWCIFNIAMVSSFIDHTYDYVPEILVNDSLEACTTEYAKINIDGVVEKWFVQCSDGTPVPIGQSDGTYLKFSLDDSIEPLTITAVTRKHGKVKLVTKTVKPKPTNKLTLKTIELYNNIQSENKEAEKGYLEANIKAMLVNKFDDLHQATSYLQNVNRENLPMVMREHWADFNEGLATVLAESDIKSVNEFKYAYRKILEGLK